MKEVICIKNHSKNVVVKDKIYTVYSILETSCNCGPKTLYDVGVKSVTGRTHCGTCKHPNFKTDSPVHWLSSELFADLADISELQEILTKELTNGVS